MKAGRDMIVDDKLAIEGGNPAFTGKFPPMFPGGMEIDEREENAVLEVLRSKRLFRYYGPGNSESKVEAFERQFAAINGAKYALGLNSCTNALTVALLAAGIQPGDEVIIPAYTFIASAAAVVAANAIPVITEIDDSFTIDPAEIEKNITPKTKAIMPVHMRGVPCDMDAVITIAAKHNLEVIEDTAQANGGYYKGKPLGTIGNAGCFSFQFHKIITAGEGGAIVTNNPEIYYRALSLHDTGANWRYEEDKTGIEYPIFPGFNHRMNELTGAILLVQLEKRKEILCKMRDYKKQIRKEICDIKGIQLRRLHDEDGETGIALMFTLDSREKALKIGEALRAEGIKAGAMGDRNIPDWHIYLHWPHILNKRGNNDTGYPFTLSDRTYSKDMCPRTIDLLERAIHMDISPMFTQKDVDEIKAGLRKVLLKLA